MFRIAGSDTKDLYGLIDPRLYKTDTWYVGEYTFKVILYNCFIKGYVKLAFLSS